MHLCGHKKLDTDSPFLNIAFIQFLISLMELIGAVLSTQDSHDMPASLFSPHRMILFLLTNEQRSSCFIFWMAL